MQLPTELWQKILIKSVVDTAILSDSPSCLEESLTTHSLVCRTWSVIVHQPLFLREAKAMLCDKGMLFS